MGGGGSLQHQQQVQVVDPDRPRFHVHPPQGWMNDPNGPVFYKGRYHMFYQHLPNACEWAFGIVWGHAVSTDLVHWEHLPPALEPTPGTLDADGCFSGSCVLDSDGTPVLLYTGVRLRSNESAGELPPPEQDLGMVWIETQLAAVPEDPDDELLIRWRKIPSPFLHLPPAHLQLTGWRDPFIFVTNTSASPAQDGFSANGYSQELRMLIGSGLKGQGGTALVYKSCSLLEGWELEGTLCEAQNTETGVVWECPLLVPLDPIPRHLRAPSKQLPPGWLVASHHAAAGGGAASSGDKASSGAFGSIESVSQESSGASNGIAGGASAAAGAHPKLRLGLAGALASQAAAQEAAIGQQADGSAPGANSTADGSAKQGIAALPAAAPAGVEDAAEAALAGGSAAGAAGEGKRLGDSNGGSDAGDGRDAGGIGDGVVEVATEASGQPAGFAFAEPQRADSFEFHRDLSLDDLSRAEEAASAVTAWQLQAASAGGSAAASGLASPAARGLSKSPAAAAPLSPAGTAAAAVVAAAAAGADLDAPSNAAALPPGRRGRRLLLDAKIPLESAATLEDWSAPTSQATSPVQPQSGAGTPESKPSPDRARRAAGMPPPPPRLDLSPAGRRGGRALADLPKQSEAHHEEDRFAAAFSQIRGIRPRTRSKERPPLPRSGSKALLHAAAAHEGQPDIEPSASGATEANTPVPPERQWHFFTVSPDAPTNPVLYWMGHVQDTEAARFELETAKGPFRLDLGDVLYAPNVCQDDKGRWLLWGWLQERRKMGSYNYAGCLTLPRELHCTEDGRLLQAPIPELVKLRQGAPYQQHGVRVPAEQCISLKAAPGAPALDIELTLERGTAFAAGLLFRSHGAEAEGGTALIYDWERNTLEAIFNVPPNWQPQAAAHAVPQSARHSGMGEQEAFDPAIFLTPRPGGLVSRDQSMIFSPDGLGLGLAGFDSLTGSPRTASESLAGEQSSVSGAVLSPPQGGISIAGTPRAPPLDLGIPGLAPPPHLADAGGTSNLSAAAAFSRSLPRSLSAIPAGFLAAGDTLGRSLQLGSLPARGLTRSVSDVRLGMSRVGSHSSLQNFAASLPRLGGGATPRLAGGLSPRRSPQVPQPIGADTDADLDFLLDELAAPMREAPPPVVEPRRVGGSLPLMQANQPIHLRILVDHSCVEVYTGTGEVMSTRIYRGRAPEGCSDAGISFIAFGGAALVRSCCTWEMGSAWEHPATAEPLAAKAAAGAQRSAGGSAVASPAAPPDAHSAPGPDGGADRESGRQVEPDEAQQAAAQQMAADAAAADAMLDDLVACVSPHCHAPLLAGAAIASG